MITALVPVKNFRLGKSRLSSVLGPSERERLSAFCLERVLGALRSSGGLDLICLVTGDPRAARIGKASGARVILEKEPFDLNRAIDWATTICRSLGTKSLLVLPADLPLLEPQDIRALLAAADGRPKIAICPSKEGTGTNALLRTPPAAIPARFGPESFFLHCREAKGHEIPCEVLSLPRVAFDLDTADDLRTWQAGCKDSGAVLDISASMVPG